MENPANSLFNNLPRPEDDGSCSHLSGLTIPNVSLLSTTGSEQSVDLAALEGITIVFCYPRSAKPDEQIPPEWDAIPGARGCTPQACSYRDNATALYEHGVEQLFGLSTQDTAHQQEFRQRAHLPYDLLSDKELAFSKALNLPLFEWHGAMLVRRLTLAIKDGQIVKHWFPVFPPDRNVYHVLEWLKGQR